MNIFNICRLFSRYGTTTSPYFLTRNNKLSKDSLHPEQSFNRNSAFTQKFRIYLEILRTTTDISLFALLGSYIFYKKCGKYRSCIYVSLFFLQSSVALLHFKRNVKSIVVVIRNVESFVVVYTQRKYFVKRSVALIFILICCFYSLYNKCRKYHSRLLEV